jgi:hypothetical protein
MKNVQVKTKKSITRREFLAGGSAVVATSLLGYKSLYAQIPELTQPTIVIGPPQQLYSSDEMPHYYDHQCATIRKSSTEFYFWSSVGTGLPFPQTKYSGTLENPLQKEIWGKTHHELIDYRNYPYPNACFWLGNFYKINETEYINFAHDERFEDEPYPAKCPYRIAVLYSSNAGDSWSFCGEIIAPFYDMHMGNANIGGCPYLISGKYFYIYFNETISSGKGRVGISVARAKIADVINAARKFKVTPWEKYYNGKWDQDGMKGQASPLNPGGSQADAHCDIHYNTALGKYIITCAQSGVLKLHTSTDGIHWEGNQAIVEVPLGGRYSWHLGSGGSDDCHELGSEFYVHWRGPRTPNAKKDWPSMWRCKVNIKNQ